MRKFRMFGKVILLALVISMCSATMNVNAYHRQCLPSMPLATGVGNFNTNWNGNGCNYLRRGTKRACNIQNYVDADNNGICDYYKGCVVGKRVSRRPGSLVDDDNNGVCDYYEAGDKQFGRAGRCGQGFFLDVY